MWMFNGGGDWQSGGKWTIGLPRERRNLQF